MAHETRTETSSIAFLTALEAAPGSFDFFAAMRRLECLYRDQPRWGEALRPSDEAIRLGQNPELIFQPSALTEFTRPTDTKPGRLAVACLGLFGPQGPLPLHFTEYARSRALHAGDRTLSAFVDLFHHRLLLLFYRAWATAQPTVGEDRPDNPFATYLGALLGIGAASLQNRDALPDKAKLQYAAWLGNCSRNAEGLTAMVEDYFSVAAKLEEFVGSWVEIPERDRWRLGDTDETSSLGRTTVLGGRVWSCTNKFRLVLGPLKQRVLSRFMPDGDLLPVLNSLVQAYTGDEYDWDVRLVPSQETSRQVQLGAKHRLGWGSRLGGALPSQSDHHVVVHPYTGRTRRVRPQG